MLCNVDPRVLIVDDHAEFRRLARALLTRSGFDVVAEAADAGEAMIEARAHRPDLVLLDVHLPGVDGIAVAHALDRELPATDVVLISARSPSDIGPRLKTAPVRGFVPKNRLSRDSLEAALRRTA